MLIGINPLLHGDFPAKLDHMGHGDTIVIADANFPAHRLNKNVVALAGIKVTDALRAVLSVFPLDTNDPALLMESTRGVLPIHAELVGAIPQEEPLTVEYLSRNDFYERASLASVVALTGELRPYGNIILSKGVVNRVADQ
jgi:L-fucose mutarotase